MANARKRPTILQQERWLLGEGTAAELASVQASLAESEQATLRADDVTLREQLFARLPAARLTSQVRARAVAEAEPAGRSWLWASAALIATCALLLLWRPLDGPEGTAFSTQDRAEERSKGLAPGLHVYRRRGAFAERLGPEAQLRAHDVLQLGYVAAGRKHGVLLSIDGAGQVTLHFPLREDGATTLPKPQGEQLLTTAYELDDAPDFERFFWIVSQQPLAVPRLLSSARALAADKRSAARELLTLPSGTEQYSLLLHKEPP